MDHDGEPFQISVVNTDYPCNFRVVIGWIVNHMNHTDVGFFVDTIWILYIKNNINLLKNMVSTYIVSTFPHIRRLNILYIMDTNYILYVLLVSTKNGSKMLKVSTSRCGQRR